MKIAMGHVCSSPGGGGGGTLVPGPKRQPQAPTSSKLTLFLGPVHVKMVGFHPVRVKTKLFVF